MKRFYKQVSVAPSELGWQVFLDGRGIKTAALGRPQIVPSSQLADAMAQEWSDQGEEIDPRLFVLRDMADYAIEIVSDERETVIANLLRFAETDTLCYRADPDEALFDRQTAVWEPLLQAAEQRWDVHFERISGIIHRPQPEQTLNRLRTVLQAESDFALAALNTLASLAASLVIGLAALAPEANADSLWNAANLEEDWQAELWGQDGEALALRTRRFATFFAAMGFARAMCLMSPGPRYCDPTVS